MVPEDNTVAVAETGPVRGADHTRIESVTIDHASTYLFNQLATALGIDDSARGLRGFRCDRFGVTPIWTVETSATMTYRWSFG